MFPQTTKIEIFILFSHKGPVKNINMKVDYGQDKGKFSLDTASLRAEQYKPKYKVTYEMIQAYIEEKYRSSIFTQR